MVFHVVLWFSPLGRGLTGHAPHSPGDGGEVGGDWQDAVDQLLDGHVQGGVDDEGAVLSAQHGLGRDVPAVHPDQHEQQVLQQGLLLRRQGHGTCREPETTVS